MRVLFLLCLSLIAASAKERWVYLPANYQVDAEADRVIGLLTRAKAAGYDHALIMDSKFARIGTLPKHDFKNVDRVKQSAAKLGIELVPALFPVGYSNDLLFHDPNLAEGLPVRDALFVVHGAWEGLDPSVTVMNWNFGQREKSLMFFAQRGNHQILAGFYDEPLEHVSNWLESARIIPRVDGFMYTTWRQDYSKLEEVAGILVKHGF